MIRFIPSLIILLASSLLNIAHAAQPVYKCSVDGKPVYADRPCADGRGTTLAPAPPGIAAIAADPGTGDSRALLALEQARTERARQEAIENREQRAQARAGRVQVRQVQRCDKLKLQGQWLADDLAQARTAARRDALRTRLQRQRASTAVECPG